MTIEVVQTIALGVSAGVLSGLFGVGGGLLFVPALVLVGDLSQLDAAATSLAAMLPVVVVGTAVQARRGLVQWRVTMVVGLVSVSILQRFRKVGVHLGSSDRRQLFGKRLLNQHVAELVAPRWTRYFFNHPGGQCFLKQLQ